MALDLGSEMLGEIVVFSVAVFTLWLEYKRQSINEANRENAQFEQLDTINKQLLEIELRQEESSTQFREMNRKLVYLEHQIDQNKIDQNKSQSSPNIILPTAMDITTPTKPSSKLYDTVLFGLCVAVAVALINQNI